MYNVNRQASIATKTFWGGAESVMMVVAVVSIWFRYSTLGQDINHELWSARCLHSDPGSIERAHFDYFAHGEHVKIATPSLSPLPFD
eukprot:3795324-Amphidinium_carterae.6